MTDARIRERLRRQVAHVGSARTLAAMIGVSNTYLSSVLKGEAPGPKILAYLGLERTSTITRKKVKA